MDTILDQKESLALTKWYIQEKRLDKALLQVKPLLEQGKTSPELSLIAARLYAQLGLFEYAEDFFTQYLSTNNNDLAAKFQLGMCFFDNNEIDIALSTWTEILEQQPNHPPALFYSSIVLLQQGNTDKAVSQLKQIINSTPLDNLYYNKSKDLIIQIENQSLDTQSLPSPDIYQTEH